MIHGKLIMSFICPKCKKEQFERMHLLSVAVVSRDNCLIWTGQCSECFEIVEVKSK